MKYYNISKLTNRLKRAFRNKEFGDEYSNALQASLTFLEKLDSVKEFKSILNKDVFFFNYFNFKNDYNPAIKIQMKCPHDQTDFIFCCVIPSYSHKLFIQTNTGSKEASFSEILGIAESMILSYIQKKMVTSSYIYKGSVITASSKNEAIHKIVAGHAWNLKEFNECRDYKRKFEEYWKQKVENLENKLKGLRHIQFTFFYGDDNRFNEFDKFIEWCYVNGYDVDKAPIKLLWWVAGDYSSDDERLTDIEKLIGCQMDDDSYWIFKQSNLDISEWYDKVKKANDYIEKHPEEKSASKQLMKKYNYNGKLITANSKQEAITKIIASQEESNQKIKRIKQRIKSSILKEYRVKDINDNSFKIYHPTCASISATEAYDELIQELLYYRKVSNYKLSNDRKYLIVTVLPLSNETKVTAFNKDTIRENTKLFFEDMNKGEFFYNYRIDKNFQDFIDNTLEDEIHDIIRSDKNLIRQCIEKRVANHSIVWSALYQIFEEVRKRWNLKSTVTNELIKNWFLYNDTDYKTALKKIVDNLTDFREELRESD